MRTETKSIREELEKFLEWAKSDEVQQAITKVNAELCQMAKTYNEQRRVIAHQIAKDIERKR